MFFHSFCMTGLFVPTPLTVRLGRGRMIGGCLIVYAQCLFVLTHQTTMLPVLTHKLPDIIASLLTGQLLSKS